MGDDKQADRKSFQAFLEPFKGIRIILIPLMLTIAITLLQADILSYIRWWLTLLGLGLIFFPMSALVFGKFTMKGYFFAKIIGLAMGGFTMWLAASYWILPFRAWAAYLILILFLCLNIYIFNKKKIFDASVTDADKKALMRRIVLQEVLFMFLLAYWGFLRGLKPGNNNLEYLMDFGFMNSVLRSDYFPPPDMWYAGKPINYYYLGQYFAGYMARISGVDAPVAYNLMIATLFSVSFMEAFTIGQMLLQIFQENVNYKLHKYAEMIVGVLSGALVCLSGNLHTVIYAWLFKKPDTNYWFPDATRYIGFNPPVPTDETIHEFPLYSYIVSDLHAHVINMIFVLVVIAAAIAVCAGILIKIKESPPPAEETIDESEAASTFSRKVIAFYHRLSEYCPVPGCLLIIFLIGLFPATNFWDFPIYLVVSAALVLYANLRRYDYSIKSVMVTGVLMVVIAAAAYGVVYLPFQTRFEAISTQIKLVTTGSRFYQLLVLYGYQATFFVMLFGTAYFTVRTPSVGKKIKMTIPNIGAISIPVRERQRPAYFDFIENINPADAIVLLMFVCAIGLIAMPEIIYIKDIYPGAPRANTMFKLCYQAFIMLALGVGYTYTRLFLHASDKTGWRTYLHIAASVLILCAFIYPFYAIGGWYGSLHFSNYKGLDGTKVHMLTHEEKLTDDPDAPAEKSLEDDYVFVQYLRENEKEQPVVAEAQGPSYTSYGRISAYTGLPNLINWRHSHQWLWRNTQESQEIFDEFDVRCADIETLFTAPDVADMRMVVEKYGVRYIVVGKIERKDFGDRINESALKELGDVVAEQNNSYLIHVRG